MAHRQLNSGDLLNSCWHARHGGQYKAQTDSRGEEKEVQSAFHDGAICCLLWSNMPPNGGGSYKMLGFLHGLSKTFHNRHSII